MFGKLRRKLVLIVMISLFIVELIIVITINGINFYNLDKRTDTLLSEISAGGGSFIEMTDPNLKKRYDTSPGYKPEGDPPEMPESHSGDDSLSVPASSSSSSSRTKKKLSSVIGGGELDIETRYSTRFFTVKVNSKNDITQINTSRIAALSANDAKEFAQKILALDKETGYLDNYKYLVSTDEESGSKLVIVIDVNSDIGTAQNFLIISCLVAFGSLVVVTILVAVFSRRAIKPMIENMERQKQFITDAGHEIKTPLAIISANTEVIEMISGESEWTDSIKNQSKRLSELVARLLKLAKMEEEVKNELVITEFNISDAVIDTAEPFITLAKSKNKELTLDIAEGLMFTGDEASIRELTSILTENAVKYADENSEIKLALKKQGKEIRLSVFNKGEPIDEKSLPRLFDRFYREDSSRTRETGGSGIGLSIAKAIVTAHKGTISAKNTDGGIMFTAVLVKGKTK